MCATCMDVLGVIDTPQVVLETTQTNAARRHAAGRVGPEEFTHVIMPMQLTR